MKQTFFLGAALLAGCANQSTPAPAPPAAPPTHAQQMPGPTVRLESPVKVRWEERARTATSAEVVAHVERLNAVPVPLLLRVEAPAGVTVKQGRTKVELPANSEAGTVSETYFFAFDATPTEDVMLRVDGDSEGMGFHFQVPYRFGRAAPEGPQPAATGPAFQKGGKSFGPTIPLGDTPQQPK
ncbi:MAG: hypothetical protein AB1938_06325 [Myxococcota bacterium]